MDQTQHGPVPAESSPVSYRGWAHKMAKRLKLFRQYPRKDVQAIIEWLSQPQGEEQKVASKQAEAFRERRRRKCDDEQSTPLVTCSSRAAEAAWAEPAEVHFESDVEEREFRQKVYSAIREVLKLNDRITGAIWESYGTRACTKEAIQSIVDKWGVATHIETVMETTNNMIHSNKMPGKFRARWQRVVGNLTVKLRTRFGGTLVLLLLVESIPAWGNASAKPCGGSFHAKPELVLPANSSGKSVPDKQEKSNLVRSKVTAPLFCRSKVTVLDPGGDDDEGLIIFASKVT